jgi:hypothetical protein
MRFLEPFTAKSRRTDMRYLNIAAVTFLSVVTSEFKVSAQTTNPAGSSVQPAPAPSNTALASELGENSAADFIESGRASLAKLLAIEIRTEPNPGNMPDLKKSLSVSELAAELFGVGDHAEKKVRKAPLNPGLHTLRLNEITEAHGFLSIKKAPNGSQALVGDLVKTGDFNPAIKISIGDQILQQVVSAKVPQNKPTFAIMRFNLLPVINNTNDLADAIAGVSVILIDIEFIDSSTNSMTDWFLEDCRAQASQVREHLNDLEKAMKLVDYYVKGPFDETKLADSWAMKTARQLLLDLPLPIQRGIEIRLRSSLSKPMEQSCANRGKELLGEIRRSIQSNSASEHREGPRAKGVVPRNSH